MSKSDDEFIGPYILGKTLGVGATGKVKLGTDKDTGKKVAIKIMKKSMLIDNPKLRRKVEREIAVMRHISHPNVVSLYDVYQTKQYLFLIMEWVPGGELFDYLVKRGNISIKESFKFFKQIVLGVDYCHSKLICHRDLKPENLLIDEKGNIKIGDFGMASMIKEGTLLETSCGSPHYVAPEVVKGELYNGIEADIWSIGVILYALVCGKLPFDDDNIPQLLKKVKNGEFSIPSTISEDNADLIKKMLTVDPKKRISIAEIKKHSWWKKLNEISKDEVETEEDKGNDHSIKEIDEKILPQIISMGWNKENLCSALQSKEKNIEKVLYLLLLDKKNKGIKDEVTLTNMSVTPNNPLEDNVDNNVLLKQKILEDKLLSDVQNSNNKFKKKKKKTWFAFWTKKKEKKEYVVDSKLGLSETLAELCRCFKSLNITWQKVSDSVIRAKCSYSDIPVEFDISIVEKTNGGYMLKFQGVSGNESTTLIVFDVIRLELHV